jgi:hypothetical protein
MPDLAIGTGRLSRVRMTLLSQGTTASEAWGTLLSKDTMLSSIGGS